MLEDLDQSGTCQRSFVDRHIRQRIEPVRLIVICQIKVDQILNSVLWNSIPYTADQITVRIQKSETSLSQLATVSQIGHHQGLKHGRFARSRLTQEIHMCSSVRQFDTKRLALISEICLSKDGDI